MKTMPEYTDGVLDLYQIEEDTSEDYPLEHLRNTECVSGTGNCRYMTRHRAKLSADSIEVTMKISIPRYKGINSKSVCVIDGVQHEVYNAAHVTSKDGFPETELTLKTAAQEREVIDDKGTVK